MEKSTKERCKGLVSGILIGALLTGGAALAKNTTEMIEVNYSNIKVFKDNVLCELKDANGKVIEPFIYNGTTYMPVRGTASLADMDVTWDGASKSVYLWDDLVPDGTYLLDVCPPYSTTYWIHSYLQSNGDSFAMAGKEYSNGFKVEYAGYALFNLDSKYSEIECTIGHTGEQQYEKSVSFIVDGKLVKKVTLEPEELPKTVSIPVSYGLQLKIVTSGSNVGIGNITVK